MFRDRPEREYLVIVVSEDLGGVTLRIDEGWPDVPGPKCMNGVSVAVWDLARARMRREHKHIEKLVEPVVYSAIGFAQMADAESRKRLGIRYRPKTPEELENLRNSIGPAVHLASAPIPNSARPAHTSPRSHPDGTQAPAHHTLTPP